MKMATHEIYDADKVALVPIVATDRTRFVRTKMIETRKLLSLRKPAALLLLISLIALSGCATLGFKQPEPVTVGQVVQMSKDGVPPDTIVKKLRDSDTVYRLSAAQLAELHDMGVPDPVLNYMQQTYIQAERREQTSEDWAGYDMWAPSPYTW
jgi:hypothetical protein